MIELLGGDEIRNFFGVYSLLGEKRELSTNEGMEAPKCPRVKDRACEIFTKKARVEVQEVRSIEVSRRFVTKTARCSSYR